MASMASLLDATLWRSWSGSRWMILKTSSWVRVGQQLRLSICVQSLLSQSSQRQHKSCPRQTKSRHFKACSLASVSILKGSLIRLILLTSLKSEHKERKRYLFLLKKGLKWSCRMRILSANLNSRQIRSRLVTQCRSLLHSRFMKRNRVI